MGHAAAAFAMPLAKISLLAGGQAEVPDVTSLVSSKPIPIHLHTAIKNGSVGFVVLIIDHQGADQ